MIDTLTVALEEPLDKDECELLIAAISMFENVAFVTANKEAEGEPGDD